MGVNFGAIVVGEAVGLGSITTGSEAIDPLAIPVVVGLLAQLVMTFTANNWFTFGRTDTRVRDCWWVLGSLL